jgi:hypothetical protein
VAGQGGIVVPDLDAGAGAAAWGRMRAHSKVPPTRVACHSPIRTGAFVGLRPPLSPSFSRSRR